jgi:hypothetical protein
MKRFCTSLVAVAALALTAASIAAAHPAKTVTFSAKYAGQASASVNGQVANIAANGTGSGTLIGAGSITGTGTGDASSQPCVPFGGLGKMTGTAGTTVSFKVITSSQGCGDEGGHVFTLKGYATVLKATGKLAKAKGQLKFTGVYDRDGGTFSVKFTGLLKK